MTLHFDLKVNANDIGRIEIHRSLNGPAGFHDYRAEYRDTRGTLYAEFVHQEADGALECVRRAVVAITEEDRQRRESAHALMKTACSGNAHIWP